MRPSFLKSINNITDFIKEHESKGKIDPHLIAEKIESELSLLNKEELFDIAATLLFKDIAEEFFTKESVEKILKKYGN